MKAKNSFICCQCANRFGLFLVILFAICFSWYFIHPVDQGLHFKLLRMSYLGFDGMNLKSFILGAVQTYLWAYLFLGIWGLVCCGGKKDCCKD